MNAHIELKNNIIFVSGQLNFEAILHIFNASLPLLSSSMSWQFDFSKVESVNSGGLILLLKWIKLAQTSGKAISFAHVPAALISIAAVCNLEKVLTPFMSSGH